MAKSDHLLAILWMLQSGKKVTAQYISEQLEMNIRTVYRYIDTLSASGVPIVAEAGHHGGYTLLPQFIGAPLFFDAEEQTVFIPSSLFLQRKLTIMAIQH
ncbi:HTH domain-containing protein [Exiguobacterium sp. SL14]|nr:HTH domain-containing protein [Exiguobacterium sp. SL14]MCY1691490.1 HTH domain-containing protein [Exiguobacterium sp. SL14]